MFCYIKENIKENVPPMQFSSHFFQKGPINLIPSQNCYIFAALSIDTHIDHLMSHIAIWLYGYTLCNFLPYMSMNPNSSVILTAIRSTVDIFFKRLKNKSKQLLNAEPSTHDIFQTCQLLTAIPSAVNKFAFFEKVRWLC